MNVELFERVRDHIRNNPEDYDQGDWCRCISGHALILSGVADRGADLGEFVNDAMIQAMLGIDADQVASLVWLRGWPEDLYSEFMEAQAAKDKRGEARAAVERISRFLAAVEPKVELASALVV
jgi:hypothetical protein